MMTDICCEYPLLEKLRSSGWSNREDELLKTVADEYRSGGKPLCAAFKAVADLTGRQPDSVRNHYYFLAKADRSMLMRGREEPLRFTDKEVDWLLREMLTAIAEGGSVRGCALRLGCGDKRLMLRYQNKYRSILTRNRALADSVAEELRQSGIPVPDIYPSGSRSLTKARNEKDRISAVYSAITSMDKNELNTLFRKLSEYISVLPHTEENGPAGISEAAHNV